MIPLRRVVNSRYRWWCCSWRSAWCGGFGMQAEASRIGLGAVTMASVYTSAPGPGSTSPAR